MKPSYSVLFAAFLFAACTATVDSDGDAHTVSMGVSRDFDSEAIDEVVETYLEENNVVGVAVAVVRGDEVLLSKGYGLASLELEVPVGPETMFQSGSVGKMFTAAGIMVLVEDGLIDLDASVREYLEDAPEEWQDITVRHLLTHTSGIPDYTSDDFDYLTDLTEEELVEMAGALELEFPAGSRWNYSNTAYVMLGILTHRVSGKTYWDLLRQRVWDPGNVPTMRVNFAADIVPHRSQGYYFEEEVFQNQEWLAPSLNSTADGSLLMSLEDMIAWNEVVRNRAVLSEESWEAMLTPVTLNSGNPYPYGFGWGVNEVDGRLVHQHGGGWQGFRTQYSRMVEDDLAVIVLANTGHADPGDIAQRVFATLDPKYESVPPTEPIEDPDPETTALVSATLDKASRGELELSDFAFIRQTSFPMLKKMLAENLDAMGAPDRMELLERTQRGDDWRLTYRAWYEDKEYRVSAAIGPEGGLTRLYASEADS